MKFEAKNNSQVNLEPGDIIVTDKFSRLIVKTLDLYLAVDMSGERVNSEKTLKELEDFYKVKPGFRIIKSKNILIKEI